jgi:predicted ribosomally synthesized peptide with SipW-like signal peptide
MSTETPNEDYVLVHKSKVRISRARKFVMGTMAIGAVAAITGAGTFASFSASTDNDATFQTATVILTNKTSTGNVCWSSNDDNTTPALDTNLDANGTTCDSLLTANLVPGTAYTTYLKLSNEGNATGDLKLFDNAGGCSGSINDNNGTNEVQRITITSPGVDDTFTVSFDGSAATAAIPYDESAANLDTALEALTTLTGTTDVSVAKDGADFVITFDGGTFANSQVPQLVVDDTGMDSTGPAAATASTTTEGLSVVNAGSLAASICSKIQLSVVTTSPARTRRPATSGPAATTARRLVRSPASSRTPRPRALAPLPPRRISSSRSSSSCRTTRRTSSPAVSATSVRTSAPTASAVTTRS